MKKYLVKNELKIFSLLAVIPVMLFVFCAVMLSTNIPFGDDFPAILNYLNLHIQANSFHERFRLLFSLHAEHQIIICKLFTLLNYFLSGIVNLKFLIFCGNLSLVGIILVLYKSFSISTSKIYYFVPVFFLLFNFSYGQSVVWAQVTLSNFFVMFFAFLTIYLIHNTKNGYFIFALCSAFITSFTFGNGILVFIPLGFVLIRQKKYIRFFILLILFLITIKLYYSFGSIVPADRSALKLNPEFIIKLIIFFFTFVGSITKNLYLSFTLGIIIIGFIGYLTYTKYYNKNSIVYSLILFLLISTMVASVTRTSFGVRYALSTRYAFYSSLYLVFCYVAFIEIYFANSPEKAIDVTKKLIIILLPISLITYLIFPEKTLYDQTFNTIPYTYFVQKQAGSYNFPIQNPIELYDSHTKQLSNSVICKILPPVRGKMNHNLIVRREIFKRDSIEFGDIKTDALILKTAVNNKIYFQK
jgi:hypothetical protein